MGVLLLAFGRIFGHNLHFPSKFLAFEKLLHVFHLVYTYLGQFYAPIHTLFIVFHILYGADKRLFLARSVPEGYSVAPTTLAGPLRAYARQG